MLAEYESWVANMKMKRSHSAICTLKCHKGLRTLGTFRIPEEVHILVRNSILCFEKVWASSQIFLPWVTWQCSRILIWSVAVIFSHFPICSNLQTWEGLEHFLPWRQKKEQSFFSRFTGNNSENVVPSLQWKRPAFEKSCDPGAVLILCFLPVRSRAGLPGGEASGFTLEVLGTVLDTLTIVAACKSLGYESRGVKLGTELGTEPPMMWFLMFEQNLAVNLTIFTIRVMVSLDPSSPCWIKLLFTELVEKLASWDKTLCNIFRKIYGSCGTLSWISICHLTGIRPWCHIWHC